MSEKAKKVFLVLTIVVPFLLYCVYYYGHMIKNAPYKFSEFKSFTIIYGTADSMLNKYNSKTGDYQYLNRQDSLVKMNLRLSNSDLLYLHRKAAELGFWDFPSDETGDSTKVKGKPLRYYIEFAYQRKSKKVLFDESFAGDPKLRDANMNLIKEINRVLADAEEKRKK
ncbi:MAG TPA: hypothetical protein VHA56_03380 [Mucilaginibacter sp.]|nr:hypothetical protein [Mucilaginibacter sp.]